MPDQRNGVTRSGDMQATHPVSMHCHPPHASYATQRPGTAGQQTKNWNLHSHDAMRFTRKAQGPSAFGLDSWQLSISNLIGAHLKPWPKNQRKVELTSNLKFWPVSRQQISNAMSVVVPAWGEPGGSFQHIRQWIDCTSMPVITRTRGTREKKRRQ